MKKFIVETNDQASAEDIGSLIYLGNHCLKRPDYIPVIVPTSVTEVTEVTYERPRMTMAQRDKFWELCGRYGVPFREDDYVLSRFSETSPEMYEGWIGGREHNGNWAEPKATIYVGVEPDGRSHS